MPPKPTTTPAPKVSWTPCTEIDLNRVRLELDSLTQNDLFRRSNRYAALLRYIVEKTLAGESSSLKERSIGIDVFKRPNDYDTNADPVVRFCAAEVRRRLAQFYKTSPSSEVEIELPLGTYVPRFLLATPPLEPITDEPTDLPEKDVPKTPFKVPDPPFRSPKPAWRWPVFAILALLAIAGSWQFAVHRYRSTPLEQVWKPLLNTAVPLQLCTGVPPDSNASLPAQNISIQQEFLQPGHKVSLATASAIAKLSGFLERQGQPFSLVEADATGIDNLRDHPLVLINANNNRWTLFLLKPLRYHFDFKGDTGSIIDTEHPEAHQWMVDFSQPYASQKEDFALIARIQDPTTRSPVLIIAGIGSNGTQAAADFVVSNTALADLAQRAPRNWEGMNFEALLRVEVVDGHLGATRIEETHFW